MTAKTGQRKPFIYSDELHSCKQIYTPLETEDNKTFWQKTVLTREILGGYIVNSIRHEWIRNDTTKQSIVSRFSGVLPEGFIYKESDFFEFR